MNETNDDDVFSKPVSLALSILGWIGCLWIIVAHVGIVISFWILRNDRRVRYSGLILGLSLTGLLVGIANAAFIAIIKLDPGTDGTTCMAAIYIVMVSHSATLNSILAVCFYWAKVLLRAHFTAVLKPLGVKVSLLVILLALVAAITMHAVPFFAWIKLPDELPYCRLEFIFNYKIMEPTVFFTCNYLLPLLITNVLYTITCCKLVTARRKTVPDITTITAPSSTTSNGTAWTGFRAQKTALVTIGFLLVSLNVFTLPLIGSIVYEMAGNPGDRKARIIVSLLFCMNSVVSPFVYAMRSKFLQEALSRMMHRCKAIMCCN